jgi:hypothetical protein
MKTGRAAFGAQAKKARPYMGDSVVVEMGVDLAEVERIRAAVERNVGSYMRREFRAEE